MTICCSYYSEHCTFSLSIISLPKDSSKIEEEFKALEEKIDELEADEALAQESCDWLESGLGKPMTDHPQIQVLRP